ncbi:MAG: hypothetical protein EA344_05840 [Alkalicoccus sp.]|nr:MAG: hypothetical protein EA344_05840 [Alkalicoccus sp.]
MGQLYYVYGFIPDIPERDLPELHGIDGFSPVEYPVVYGLRTACCPVPEDEFAEDALQTNKENAEWIKENAFHHHQVLNELLQNSVVIPLAFGTVYENYESMKGAVFPHKEEIKKLFRKLTGSEEWSIKIYADRRKFDDAFVKNEDEIKKIKEEIGEMPRGRQYFALKKMEEELQKRGRAKVSELCKKLHESLKPLTAEVQEKKVWRKNLSGRREEMVWNGAYLFNSHSSAEKALEIIHEFQDNADRKYPGLTAEASGPWPFYHFAEIQLSETNEEGG